MAWNIEQNGNDIKITQVSPEGAPKTSFECTTMGKECSGTSDGETAKVSYWFNGTALVEMLIEGKDGDKVTKTRRTLSEDGKKMTVEVQHISPAKESDKIVLTLSSPPKSAAH